MPLKPLRVYEILQPDSTWPSRRVRLKEEGLLGYIMAFKQAVSDPGEALVKAAWVLLDELPSAWYLIPVNDLEYVSTPVSFPVQ